jgi:hypothetical protein
MNTTPLDFATGSSLGKVARVDTNRVIIDVEDHDALTRVTVSNLLAIQGTSANEYAIGVVEGVVRAVIDGLVEDTDGTTDGDVIAGQIVRDQIRLALVGTFWSRRGTKANVFKRGADTFPQIDRNCFLIEADALQTFMSVLADDIGDDERLRLGKFVADRSALAIADGNRLFQRHAALLGSTGAGKSYAVALILERAAKLKHANLIVLDVHGEYAPLTQAATPIAKRLRVAGSADLTDPAEDALFMPFWLLNREELISMLVDQTDQSAQNQVARFMHHVQELKHEALVASGHADVAETFTADSPVPFSIAELLARLEADDVERVGAKPDGTGGRAGTYNAKLTRFILRLRGKIEDRRLGFMFGEPAQATTYEWMAETMRKLLRAPQGEPGIKIVDLSEVPSDVLPIVAAVLARTLYDVNFWLEPDKRTPLCLVCDEAHLYLPVPNQTDVTEQRSVEVFERIAKEGRKYGVALFVVSQRPADVSRTILSQCNNFIAMRLTNQADQAVVQRLMPDSLGSLTDVLPLLDLGEALILGDALLLPTRIKFDLPQIEPDSATRPFWAEWDSLLPDEDAIAAAVEAFRKQTRA